MPLANPCLPLKGPAYRYNFPPLYGLRNPHLCTVFAVHHICVRSVPYTRPYTSVYVVCRTPHLCTVVVHDITVHTLYLCTVVVRDITVHASQSLYACTVSCRTPHPHPAFSVHLILVRSSPYTSSLYGLRCTPHPRTVFAVHLILVPSSLYTHYKLP